LPRRCPCRRSSKNAGTNTGMAGETPTLGHIKGSVNVEIGC
jgi:hypothetical protein